jgi:hypothetical protein
VCLNARKIRCGLVFRKGVIDIAGGIERNGSKPSLDKMAIDMLRRIRGFTKGKRGENRDVYLGSSGIPFTVEGNKNGVEGMSVDIDAIEEVLGKKESVLEEEAV